MVCIYMCPSFVGRIFSHSSVARCLKTGNIARLSSGSGSRDEAYIPVYKARDGEDIDTKRSRLLYQSRKRGMLENGLVLSTFAARYLSKLSTLQLEQYDTLINSPSNDWDIYYWASGAVETPEDYRTEVMDLLKAFVKNEDKESRLRQPDLEFL